MRAFNVFYEMFLLQTVEKIMYCILHDAQTRQKIGKNALPYFPHYSSCVYFPLLYIIIRKMKVLDTEFLHLLFVIHIVTHIHDLQIIKSTAFQLQRTWIL